MTVTLDQDNSFKVRPEIGAKFLNLTTRKKMTVAATWESGVVFEEGAVCSAIELVTKFDPECSTCGGFHEPEYPHWFTSNFKMHIAITFGRTATHSDTFAHCTGVMRAAVSNA